MKKVIYTKNAPEPIGPYNQAILSGSTLFVSGQIPIAPGNGHIISDVVEEQTHQVMKNIKAILEEAEFGLGDVVKCSIFVSDLNNFDIINEVYGGYFTEMPPARETVEVARLPKDVFVEISCIAIK